MASEKWLYDEIDADRNIASHLDYIFEQAGSLAFAGVLISVGLKHPVLFTRELQPLLGNLYIYRCQLNWSVGERQEGWRIELSGWNEYGPETTKPAVDWHKMPHRRFDLQDVATWLMLQDEGTMRYLAERKTEWTKRLEDADEDREKLEFFLARFDPANYTETPEPDGRVRMTMRWPAHLEAIADRSQGEGELRSLSLSLAMRARRHLSGDATLDSAQLLEFAAQVQRLANWMPTDPERLEEQYRINSIAGGIAVLLVQHRSWLSQTPKMEKWCVNTLRQLRPTENSEFDSPNSVLDHTAESFLGEAGIALLLESEEEWVLRTALDGVAGFYYESTLRVMWRAYLLRAAGRKVRPVSKTS
jgi:hypothetical protein